LKNVSNPNGGGVAQQRAIANSRSSRKATQIVGLIQSAPPLRAVDLRRIADALDTHLVLDEQVSA
jgi:hypothetical protein